MTTKKAIDPADRLAAAAKVRAKPRYPRELGPRKWILPAMEASYSRLAPHEHFARGAGDPSASHLTRSTLRPDRPDALLAHVGEDLWLDRLAEYKQRKVVALPAAAARTRMIRPGAVVPGAKNWAFLGPSFVMNGQAWGDPPVAGRVSGIAVAPGGKLVYAASANGGVFRSDDGGVSWHSLMDAFDLDPTNFASTSLACGAIAIDQSSPDRIYVGTGEGDTYALFRQRITNALPAYRGIGPIRSDDGGATWHTESTAVGSPALAGKAFFALAVDPRNADNVVAATTEGLYQRTLDTGAPSWIRRAEGTHSSVVIAGTGAQTRFFSARWGDGVFASADGKMWSKLQSGFPTAGIGRIALAVQSANAALVYAMVADQKGVLAGVYRLDGPGSWKKVNGAPDVLPVNDGASQGDYDLAIAVDPVDPDLIYLGGSYFSDNNYWPASIWACKVSKSGTGYRMSGKAIGKQAHADVHVLTHTPGNPNELWTGCDGGVFLNRAPRTGGIFQSCNTGLACLCTNFFAQHPIDPGIVFCGLQDNGTARTSGTGVWTHVNGGDGGYCLVNWRDPQQVLVFANGIISRATDGGIGPDSWTTNEFPWGMMTEPIVGAPYDPAHPATGDIAAIATGRDIHLSSDFGATWPTTVPLIAAATGGVFAMTFATATIFYVGTTDGAVVRFSWSGVQWEQSRIDNVAAGGLPIRGLIADIAIDWSDSTGKSAFIAFGGIGDFRHVWRFDGTRWLARSGPASGTARLLDVEHNALVVDREKPGHVYVGADIGVWHSADGGDTWGPLPNGLPDAPVFDLQIHPTRRLLRATTHGRGLYEYALD